PEYGELGIGLTSDGRHLIAGRHAVQVVDLRTGITTRAFSRGVSESESAAISEIELRPGTTELYAIAGRYVTAYNWASGEFLRRLARYESATWSEGGNRYEFKADYITATSMAISNDGRYLASAGTEWGIRLYDLDSGRIVFTAKGMP